MCPGHAGSKKIAEGQPGKIVAVVDEVTQLVVIGHDPLDCRYILIK